ncbi:MAG: acetyl-CoA carboxylase biotin carboxylase subunit [Alphaproteobacteria bacterium]|nr:acetyl-CoA carboxylase biotin carboxylase subunit [Alphaproteobacteria bacterium]
MFKKILIANRGEIACRVIKSARKMGIKTVAVYSDADRDALHVKMADEAVHIGPAPSNQSYLVIENIIAAAQKTGAEAIHPGYGFLSEKAAFAKACEDNAIAFIGPPPKAIEAMGDKITSKKLAKEAGVSTVPGYMGLIDDEDHAAKIAGEIGYPVMIKASAGGGGKGMRIAWNDAEAREGFALSRSEAKSSFGDDRIFIEKFVTQPRHIEIQVLGDAHGNMVYLGERECSIQRRNQKVVEEAPSPFLDDATRKAMGEQAVALAKAVGYTSAGTVEFIVDGNRNFYFLEMNTRLQVEHPVTELITGIDIVETMIRVAAGEKLGLAQSDITLNGWAIESRLYAEDPYRNFLPSIGRLTRYRPPQENEGLRNDTGVYEGAEISLFYDPMIAKLCTWAPTREKAIEAMSKALDSFEVEGVGHNLPFLSAVMGNAKFKSGTITTAFIAEEFPDGFHGVIADAQSIEDMCLAATLFHVRAEQRAAQISGTMENHKRVIGQHWVASCAGASHTMQWAVDNGGLSISVDGAKPVHVMSDWMPGKSLAHVSLGARQITIMVSATTKGYRLRYQGRDQHVLVRSPRAAELTKHMPVKIPKDMSNLLLCPMPGVLRRLHVRVGDMVEAGQPLAMIEAMKMENILRSERRAKVLRVPVSEGVSLSVDELIMEFEKP